MILYCTLHLLQHLGSLFLLLFHEVYLSYFLPSISLPQNITCRACKTLSPSTKFLQNGEDAVNQQISAMLSFIFHLYFTKNTKNRLVMGHRCRNIENIDVCFRLSMFFTSIPPNRCRCVKYRYKVSMSMFLFSL